jgi:energy-coupling factor transporter ATP-binding protein EcfA2
MSTVKLKRLKINQYRNVRPGTELHFDDGVNLVLGQNAAGKTTLLSLLSAVSRSAFEELSHEEFDLEYELICGLFSIVAQVSHRRQDDSEAGDPAGVARLWRGYYDVHIKDFEHQSRDHNRLGLSGGRSVSRQGSARDGLVVHRCNPFRPRRALSIASQRLVRRRIRVPFR